MKHKIIIFDLDGTLSLCGHRRHFVEGKEKNYEFFFNACINDPPNKPVIKIFKTLRRMVNKIFILSGRSDIVRRKTVDWLIINDISPDYLFMREDGDSTPDDVLKEQWLKILQKDYEIEMVFDDRQKVVDMWRRNDITCFQVADGNF